MTSRRLLSPRERRAAGLDLSADSKRLMLYGGIALLAFYALSRRGDDGQSTAFNIGQGTGNALFTAITDTAAGAVVGAGEVFGIPATDAAACEAAKAAGNTFDASLFCPAKNFLGWWWNK